MAYSKQFGSRGSIVSRWKPVDEEPAMTLNSFIVPVVGGFSIMGACYCVGFYQLSFLWIVILVVLNIVKSYMWRKREKRLMSLRQTALQEREVVLSQLEDLPAWVQFPDTERVEWLNKVVLQLWPYVGEYAKYFLQEYIEPQVKSQLPAIFSSFRFVKMDMGDIPCRVGGIKVYTHNVGRDRIIVDMDVAYAGDADFDVTVAGFKGGLNQLQFSGKLRAVLKPLLPFPPMIGGISAYFLEKPKIDFDLTGMGEFVELPGLINAIRGIINSQVASICVLPNEIVISLAPDVDVTKLYFPEPDGVLRLKVVEARNLENRDISFTKKMKSDPYCEVQVGSQFFKTRVIDNNLNPIWNEYFEFVVDQADGQKLRFELFDKDLATKDEELGRLTIDLVNLRKEKHVESWFPLEGCKHGDLRIKATWMNLSSSLPNIVKQDWDSEWLNTDKPVHSAILMVFVDNVSNLPYPRAKLEPSPYIIVSLGKEIKQTPIKMKTVNPLYQTKFVFFVRYAEGQEIKIEAVDHNTKRSLGELAIPLKLILDEPNLEVFQQTFTLTLGAHQSPIVITARIRALIGNDLKRESVTSSFNDKGSHYANAVHIERAEKAMSDKISNDGKVPSCDDKASNSVNSKSRNSVEISPDLLLSKCRLMRQSSNESVTTIQRSQRTFGEKLFSPKHARSRETISGSRGRLNFALRHVADRNCLIINLIRVIQLQPISDTGSADSYVIIKLLTTDGSHFSEKRKTAVAERSLDPVFDNHFEFDLHRCEASCYKLQFIVKDATNYGIFAKPPVLGMAAVELNSFDLTEEFVSYWLDLEESGLMKMF